MELWILLDNHPFLVTHTFFYAFLSSRKVEAQSWEYRKNPIVWKSKKAQNPVVQQIWGYRLRDYISYDRKLPKKTQKNCITEMPQFRLGVLVSDWTLSNLSLCDITKGFVRLFRKSEYFSHTYLWKWHSRSFHQNRKTEWCNRKSTEGLTSIFFFFLSATFLDDQEQTTSSFCA